MFTTNNVGFRGDSLAEPKPAGEYRIFMVGGSTVEGLYLDDTQTLTAVMQRALTERLPRRSVKVYNAGKSGDKSDDHISILAHRLVQLEPDLVVGIMGLNDLRASLAGFDHRHFDARPAFAAQEPSPLRFRSLLTLAATEFHLPRRLYYAAKRLRPRTAQETQETITLRSSVRAAAENLRRLPVASRRPHADTAAFRRNVETIVGIARGHGIHLVLATHPVTWGTTDSVITRWHWMRAVGDSAFPAAEMYDALEELNAITRSVAARHRVPLYDLANAVSRSTAHFYDDTHFNVAGATAAGEGRARFLSERSLPGLTRAKSAVPTYASGQQPLQ